MDIDEAFFFKEQNQRIYCKDSTAKHESRAANTRLCCLTRWPNSGIRDDAQPLFDRDADSKLEMSDRCSRHSLQVETTHAYVARMRPDWFYANRLSRPQVLRIVRISGTDNPSEAPNLRQVEARLSPSHADAFARR